MKCIQYFPKHIKNGVQFERLSDSEADEKVSAHVATYCPKRLWKKHVRDVQANADTALGRAHIKGMDC